jgi:hypothetical protein
MIYVIHSKSETGFWSNDLGWVFDIEDATEFDEREEHGTMLESTNLPMSAGNDAEWMVVCYS